MRTTMAHRPSHSAGPTWLVRVLAIGLVGALLVVGCGTGPEIRSPDDSSGAPSAASRGDTVRVDVAGRTIVIPAPEGMVDFISASGQRAPGRPSGDQVVGIFLPREQLNAVLHGSRPSDLSVTASSRGGSASTDDQNTVQFNAVRAGWLAHGASLMDPDGNRIAAALKKWRAGTHQELENPLAARLGETLAVMVESPDPRSVLLLSVSHNRPTDDAEYDLHASAATLARGRILELMWTRRGSFSVRKLDQVSEEMRRWTAAVLQANP